MKSEVKKSWTKEEIQEIYHKPLLELVYQAATIHRGNNNPREVQICTLLSIKTGGCPEDCAYCGQAARYQTGIKVHALLPHEVVVAQARKAKDEGSSRFCMAAAWREVRDNRDFDKVIEMVKSINAMGLEVCCTLGMLSEKQALRLKKAGLYAYNHNLDTSAEFYNEIISSRNFENRTETIENVRNAGISVCSGGIIGMGESDDDRISMLYTLANMPQYPESVPINALSRIDGTPLENQKRIEIWDMVRMIATARILMPAAKIRLSAGRIEMSEIEQAWCFMAGANSIFTGEKEKLLVAPNPGRSEDMLMLEKLGLKPMEKHNSLKPAIN